MLALACASAPAEHPSASVCTPRRPCPQPLALHPCSAAERASGSEATIGKLGGACSAGMFAELADGSYRIGIDVPACVAGDRGDMCCPLRLGQRVSLLPAPGGWSHYDELTPLRQLCAL